MVRFLHEGEQKHNSIMEENKNQAKQQQDAKDIDKNEGQTDGKAAGKEEEAAKPEEKQEDTIEDYKEQIAALKDKYLRQAAEFDNYRKRVIKEKSELILNGGESVINSLLPIIDDFERALKNIDKSDDKATLKKGVELIYQKLIKALENNGMKTIDTENADFNTDFHEAVAMVPADDKQKGKVVDCVQKGYKLNDKVIRHAKVVVGQ